MDRITSAIIVSLVVVGCWVPHVRAQTPSVNFTTPVGTVRPGELVIVRVTVTNIDHAINAAELNLRYAADRLTLLQVSREQSALTLWPEVPTWDTSRGTIRIVGGIPHGLYAKDARVATLIFSATQPGEATVTLDTSTSAFYLNDGQGTRVPLPFTTTSIDVSSEFVPRITITSSSNPSPTAWSTTPTVDVDWLRVAGTQYSYTFSADSQQLPDTIPDPSGPLTYSNVADGRYAFNIQSLDPGGSWSPITQRWLLIDRTAPEPFILVHPDPSTVDGKQLLVWSANDQMSGVTDATLLVNGRSVGTVHSPLLLQSSWHGALLTVTVTDQAGNTQSTRWQYGNARSTSWLWLIGGIVLLLLLAVGGIWLTVHHRR